MRVDMGNDALERALRMHEEFGAKGLVTILMNLDPGPPSDAEVAGWILHHSGATPAIVTHGFTYPGLPESAGEPPYLALIGVDGTLRAAGSCGGMGSSLDKLVAEELKKRQAGWGESAALKKARSLLHGKDDLAGAAAVAHDPKTTAEDARVLEAEIEARFTLWRSSVTALIELGEWSRAQRSAAGLAKAVGALPGRSADAKALEARFAGEEAARELATEKKITAVLDKLKKGRLEPELAAPLQGIARQAPGTTTGKRAERLASWVSAAFAR
jgi:hypothetical protein